MKIKPDDIGMRFRKASWSACYFEVFDVGSHSFWGKIVDPNAGVIGFECFPIDENVWEPYITAQDFIDSVPVKKTLDEWEWN